jgi:hypothetical protein
LHSKLLEFSMRLEVVVNIAVTLVVDALEVSDLYCKR